MRIAAYTGIKPDGEFTPVSGRSGLSRPLTGSPEAVERAMSIDIRIRINC